MFLIRSQVNCLTLSSVIAINWHQYEASNFDASVKNDCESFQVTSINLLQARLYEYMNIYTYTNLKELNIHINT